MTQQASIAQVARFVDQLDTCLKQLLGLGLDAMHPSVGERLVGRMAAPDPATFATWQHLTAKADSILAQHGAGTAQAVEVLKTSAGMMFVLRVVQQVFAEMAANVTPSERAALVAALRRQREALEDYGQQVEAQIEPEPAPRFRVIEGGKA